MLKKILMIMIEIILIFSIYANIFQVNSTQISKDDVTKLYSGNVDKVGDAKDATLSIISAILNTIKVASAGIAVVIIIVIACKYMLASAGDRADIKKHAIAYVVGAIILFGVTGILGILVDISNSFNVG